MPILMLLLHEDTPLIMTVNIVHVCQTFAVLVVVLLLSCEH